MSFGGCQIITMWPAPRECSAIFKTHGHVVQLQVIYFAQARVVIDTKGGTEIQILPIVFNDLEFEAKRLVPAETVPGFLGLGWGNDLGLWEDKFGDSPRKRS